MINRREVDIRERMAVVGRVSGPRSMAGYPRTIAVVAETITENYQARELGIRAIGDRKCVCQRTGTQAAHPSAQHFEDKV
jgi:hypothetical protein